MENKAIFSGAYFFGILLGGIMTSHAFDLDCAKLTPTLCTILKQAKADSDTFSVSINFFPPAKDTSAHCRGIDPKQQPNDSCELSGYDSAYYAKLKSDAQTLFTKFELWDARRPTVRLTPPNTGTISYKGIVATKSTIIAALKEAYVSTIEDWEDYGPSHIITHGGTRGERVENQRDWFLPSGRAIAAPGLLTVPHFLRRGRD